MQPDEKIAGYIGDVCVHIKWKKAVLDIRDELQDHILCQKEALVAGGMDETEAIDRAIAQTGDAAAIGRKLNRVNRPEHNGNPFGTAALRQPLRTVLLFLLIGLTSFAFITNGAEYIVTRNQISSIGDYYQTIGVLQPEDPTQTDVTEGAKLLENSPYVAYTDWRRVASGLLTDMQNAEDEGLLAEAYSTEAMFYGVVTEIVFFNYETAHMDENGESASGNIGPCYEVTVAVDDVAIGRPEYVSAGQTVSIRATPKNRFTNQLTEDISWVKDLQIGERYFFRTHRSGDAVLFSKFNVGSDYICNASGSVEPNQFLTFQPIVDTRTYIRFLDEEGARTSGNCRLAPDAQDIGQVNYIPVRQGQSVDFDDPALAELKQDMNLALRNQSAVHLISTKDMNALPNRFEDTRGIRLKEGRWLDLADHEEARQVCMINSNFALFRGLSVGDTISLDVQDYYYPFGYTYSASPKGSKDFTTLYSYRDYSSYIFDVEKVNGSQMHDDEMYGASPPSAYRLELGIAGGAVPDDSIDFTSLYSYGNYSYYVSDTEKVDGAQMPDNKIPGTFGTFGTSGTLGAPPPPARRLELEIAGIYTQMNSHIAHDRNLIYIPDSVMPEGFGGDTLTNTDQAMFSYVLNSHEDVDAFTQEYRDALASMGLRIAFLENSADAFWEIMEPLQNAKLIVIIACALLLVLTLTLSACLYLHQRRKEFAIMRALGAPVGAVKRQILLPIAMISGAGVAVGGYTAWRYAMLQIKGALDPVTRGQRSEIPKFEPPSMLLLIVLCAAIFLLMLLILHVGTSIMSRRPVLEVLQGSRAAARHSRALENAGSAAWDTVSNRGTAAEGEKAFNRTAATQKGYKSLPSLRASGWYVLNSIIRTPLKSILTAAVAIIFVLTLGWMSRLVEHNETEIQRLSSIVNVEAEVMVDSVTAAMVATIPKTTVNAVRDSGFVVGTNVQIELPWTITAESGTAGVTAHAIDNPDALTGLWRKTSIEYAEGWDGSLFAMDYDESKAIPIAVSADVQRRLGLNLGDETSFELFREDEGTLCSLDVVIAGTFIKNNVSNIITMEGMDNTVLIPYSMTEFDLGDYMYNRACFMIDPSRNLELIASPAELDKIVRDNAPGIIPMGLKLWDEELRLVIEPAVRTLSLLGILYPIIVTASVIIAAGLAVLMVLQSVKLAAILRALGTTKARVVAMQSSEQVIVCLTGLVLGIIAACFFLGSAVALSSSSFAQAGLYLAGAFSGSVFTAMIAARQLPIDLLQIKE